MSISINSTSTIQNLATQITQKLDADRDGNLSTAEFSDFLAQFLGALQNKKMGDTSAMSSLVSALGATSTPSADSASARDVVGTLAGYDPGKLANAEHTTTKYTIGRILQYYPNTPAGLRDALPEIQQIVPGAKIAGSKRDKLDFGGYIDARGEKIGVVDVLESAGLGGRAWQWLPVAE